MNTKPPVKLTGLVGDLSSRPKAGLAPLSFASKEGTSDTGSGNGSVSLALSLIDASPLPPRVVYTQAAEDELEASMLANGQQEAIHVRPNPDQAGRYIIVDGQTRLNVFRRGKLGDTIRAEIHQDMSEVEAFWFGFRQNKDRSQPTDLDLGMSLHRILQTGGMTQEALAEQAGIKPAAMSALMAYAEMPESILSIILKSANPAKISYNLAGAIRALMNAQGVAMEMVEDFVIKIIDQDMSVKEALALKAHIIKAAGQANKPGKNKKPAFATFAGYGDLVTRRNALSLNLTGLSKEKLEEVANAIKETLSKTL